MKTIDAAQFEQIQQHLMSGVNLLQQAKIIIEVNTGAGLKLMEQAEVEIWRALQMYAALPEAGPQAAEER